MFFSMLRGADQFGPGLAYGYASKHTNEIMNQLSIIQALTGVLPGEGASGNGSQGAQAGSGAVLFSNLLGAQFDAATGVAGTVQPPVPGQQMAGATNGDANSAVTSAAQALQSGVPGVAVGLAMIAGKGSAEGSPDGASALLRIPAGVAANQPQLASAASAVGDDSGKGQILFGLINQPEDSAAIVKSPLLAAVLSPEADADAGPMTFAAGSGERDIPAPLRGISRAISLDPAAAGPATAGETDAEAIAGHLPAAPGVKATPASGKKAAPVSIPSSISPAGETGIAMAIAPDSETVAAAAKSMGPAAAPAAPQSAPAGGDAAALDSQKPARVESNSQPRPQVAAKGAGAAQPELQGEAGNSGGSGNSDGEGEPGNAAGKKNFMALAGGGSVPAPGIKTSLGSGLAGALASANAPIGLPAPGQPSAGLQSQMTPLKALENSMALQAGLILPLDGGAPVDPMTGSQTSLSASSISGGIQALQAGTPISSPAQSAAAFAQAPNFVARQVGLQISRAVSDGQNEFTIRLNPPELGRVDVRLEFQADGGVKAALTAEKPETLNLLQRDAAALERALNDAGVKTNAGSLNFSLQQGETQAGHDDSEGAGSLAAAGEETDEKYPPAGEIEITEQIIQQMVADGTVDIRV